MWWEEQVRKRQMLLSGQDKDGPALHDVFKKPPKAEELKKKLFAQREVSLAKMLPAISDDNIFQPPLPNIKGKDALVVETPKYVGGKYYVNPFGDLYPTETFRERYNISITSTSALESNSSGGTIRTALNPQATLDIGRDRSAVADELSAPPFDLSQVEQTSQVSNQTQAAQFDNVVVPTASAAVVADSKQDSEYFGSAARPEFFKLYKLLSHQSTSLGKRKPGKPVPFEGTGSEDEADARSADSARHQFLHNVIHQGNLLPLPLIIRRENMSVLDISHRSLGNQYVCALSDVIPKLPNLRSLKLRNNNLTDVAIRKLLAVILEQHVQLECIDLSENKLDEESVEQLTNLLTQRHCPLRELVLEGADLNDTEITSICSALEANKTVHTIKLRSNQLGGASEFMTIPNAVIAGAAFSNMLDVNDTIMTLDLSWNKLGPRSVTIMGSAFQVNNSLTELSLAYNKVANEGAESIGWALRTNKRLTTLDLSNNEITAHGALVLADCLCLNRSLKLLRLCGNPIGMSGGRALMATINLCSSERVIDMKRCTFDVCRTAQTIDPVYPVGKHKLDLTKPIDLAIANTIIRAATFRAGCSLTHVHVTAEMGSQVTKRSVKLVRPESTELIFGVHYGIWSEPGVRPPSDICQLSADDWEKLLEVCALQDADTGEKFSLPARGRFQCELVYTPKMRRPIEALNATGMQRLIHMLQSNPLEWSTYLTLASDFVFETWHMEQLIDSLSETERRKSLELMSLMLPSVYDTSNIEQLLKEHLPPAALEKLSQEMGQLYYILVNAPTGHYHLRLDRQNDRRTALRLAELSSYENAYLAANTSWLEDNPNHPFTAQKFVRSNFRNEVFKGQPMKAGLTSAFFAAGLTDQTNGVLEFDYVSTSRPSESVCPTPNRAVRNRMITQGIFLHDIQDLSSVMQDSQGEIVRSTQEIVRPSSARCSITPHRSKVPTRPWSAPLSCEAMAHAEELQRLRPCLSLSKGHLGVLKAVARSKRTLGQWIRSTDVTDVASLRQFLQHQNVRLPSLNELELQNLVDDLQRRYVMVFAEQVLSAFSKVAQVRIRPNMDSDMVLAAGSSTTPGSAQTKHTRKLYQRQNHLRPLAEDVYVGEGFFYIRIDSSSWGSTGTEVAIKRVIQQLFSDRELAVGRIQLKRRDTRSKSQNVVCPQLRGINYHTVLEEVDAVIDGLDGTMDATSVAVFPSKTGHGPGHTESITRLDWQWTQQLPPKDVERLRFWSKVAGLRVALGNVWLNTAQARAIAEHFPLIEYDVYPRETVLVSLFSRVIDLENFHLLLDLLPQDRRSVVMSRLGWFNVVNPLQVDQFFDLNLSIPEERRMAEVLTTLAVAEPGNTFLNPLFARRPELPFIPGWELPVNWLDTYIGNLPKGIPLEGNLLVTYTSEPKYGCYPVVELRKYLLEQKFLLAVPRPKPMQTLSTNALLALITPKRV